MCLEMLLRVFGNSRNVEYLFALITEMETVGVLRVVEENRGLQRHLNANLNLKSRLEREETLFSFSLSKGVFYPVPTDCLLVSVNFLGFLLVSPVTIPGSNSGPRTVIIDAVMSLIPRFRLKRVRRLLSLARGTRRLATYAGEPACSIFGPGGELWSCFAASGECLACVVW